MKFVKLFAYITKPLNLLLRKDTKFHWSLQCQAAFKHLKQTLCKEPMLQYPSTRTIQLGDKRDVL